MTKPYFITATGTDQGKTMLTTLLCRELRAASHQVDARKPIISGYDGSAETDTARILDSLGQPLNAQMVETCSPWRFAAPLAPDIAAAREGRNVDWEGVVAWCKKAAVEKQAEIFLLEGAGGIMSPLVTEKTNLDLAVALGYPVILVSASYLGCISHILTAMAVLMQAGITVKALALSQADQDALPIEEVLLSLHSHLPAALPVFTIPYQGAMTEEEAGVRNLISMVVS